VKETKGLRAIRKLLVWKTNKELVNSSMPAFVIHWTDYSPGRASPLDREVKLAPTREIATQIADQLVEANIKKGWEQVWMLSGPVVGKDELDGSSVDGCWHGASSRDLWLDASLAIPEVAHFNVRSFLESQAI
jgi:hypothetical protein